MDEEPQPVMMVATCHTSGCPEAEKPIEAPFFPNTEPPLYRAVCAGCGNTVTDIVPYVAATT